MEQVIEQGNYYRVVERDGKFYPEWISSESGTWYPYRDLAYENEGNIVVLDSREEVKAFWQRKEF